MSASKFYIKTESVNTKEGSVNTMTENSKTLSIRLSNKDKDDLSKYLNRESAEALLRQIRCGEIELTRKGVVNKGVNTGSQGVNTTIERLSEKNPAIHSVNTISESVNTADCENCPYMNDLDLSKFDEVCEYKGIDRQKALDRCAQMLWR